MFFKVLTVLCLAAVAVSGCGSGCGGNGRVCRSVDALADYPSLSAGCNENAYLPGGCNTGYNGEAYLAGGYNAGYNRDAYLSYPQTYAPRTIAESCKCTKTVVRPQVTRKIVNIPTVRQELRTEVKPVVETIRYRTQPSSSSCGFPSGFGTSATYQSAGYGGDIASIGAYSPLVSGLDYNNIVDSSALVSSNGYGYGVGSASCAY